MSFVLFIVRHVSRLSDIFKLCGHLNHLVGVPIRVGHGDGVSNRGGVCFVPEWGWNKCHDLVVPFMLAARSTTARPYPSSQASVTSVSSCWRGVASHLR